MTVQTLLYLNDTSPSTLTFSDVSGYPPVNYKVKIYKDGQTFLRAEYTLQDQENPTSTENFTPSSNGDGLLTFSDGDTFNTNTRVYTFASGTNRFQTSNLGPTDTQEIDPNITLNLMFKDGEGNTVGYPSKLTKVEGVDGIIASTNANGKLTLSIDPAFTPSLPDDLVGQTLSVSGDSTLQKVTATEVTATTLIVDYIQFNTSYTLEEALALPGSAFCRLTTGQLIAR